MTNQQKEQAYQEFLIQDKKEQEIIDKLSAVLNSYDWRNEKVRMGSEYRKVYTAYQKAFKAFQKFNKNTPAAFKRRKSKEHRQRQIEKNNQ
jgi:hypothetical protein